ncbi:MAG: hypothetical protein J4F40_15600 [Alphaproteobacteria bacterium]|nr:hypothetical protein [Alphaproteobacteria bacterium]
MARFGDAPEHPVDAGAQLPFAVADLADQQYVGFAQVRVGTVRVSGVVAKERRQGDASALGVLEIQAGRCDEAAGVRPLAGMRGGFRIPAVFDAHVSRELVCGDPGLGPRAGTTHRSGDPDNGECRAAKGIADRRRHTRFGAGRYSHRSSAPYLCAWISSAVPSTLRGWSNMKRLFLPWLDT